MNNTAIEWTHLTWNPVHGCTKVSPGCTNCYAEAIDNRFGRDFSTVSPKPGKLDEPMRVKEPSLIFVNSMSDLFHKDIPWPFFRAIWETMAHEDRHIYQVLTKRPHRMAHMIRKHDIPCPPHIWLGTSVENQTFANNRIPALLDTPAPVKWLSCEPLLGPLILHPWLKDLQWVVDGGESGPNRRPADPQWFDMIRAQCKTSRTPYFHKQGNAFRSGQDRELNGITYSEFPKIDHPALLRSVA